MHKLYHLSLIFKGVPKMRDLEVAFSDAEDDWVRISAFSWIIWSPKRAIEIFGKLKPLLDSDDRFFIVEVDFKNSSGFLAPWIWTWINSKIPGIIEFGEGTVTKLIEQRKPPSS